MRNATLTLILLVLVGQVAQAQLKKGDWMLGLRGNLASSSQSILRHNGFSTSFSPEFGYMLNGRWMVGGSLRFSSYNYSGGDYLISNFGATPFVRYYFLQKDKWAAFAHANAQFGRYDGQYTYNDSIYNWSNSGNALALQAAIGVNYFVAPNVSVEANLTGRGVQFGDYELYPSKEQIVFLSLGMKTFLHERFADDYNLQERYVRKGNRSFSASANIRPALESTLVPGYAGKLRGVDFYLSPSYHEFVRDRLVVGGGLTVVGNMVPGNTLLIGLAGIEISPYLPIGSRTYAVLGSGAQAGYTYYKGPQLIFTEYDTVETISGPILLAEFDTTELVSHYQQIGLNFEPALRHFTKKNHIWEAGIRLGVQYQIKGKFLDANIDPYVGFEHFFAENLSFYGQLYYGRQVTAYWANPNIDIYPNGNRQLGLSFGLKYFIFGESLGSKP